MKLYIFLLMSAAASAQIESPQIGVMLDAAARARPVQGAPSAAVLGKPWFDGAILSLGCSEHGCIAKTERALFSTGGAVVEAPRGAAIVALDPVEEDSAYVYFIQSGKLARWHGGALEWMDFTPGGDVLSLRAIASGFEFCVERNGEVWMGERNLGVANAVFLLDGGGVLLAAGGQVRLLRPEGTEIDFAVPGESNFVGGFLRMSDRYVQVITAGGMWALDVEPGREQIFLLPGTAQ